MRSMPFFTRILRRASATAAAVAMLAAPAAFAIAPDQEVTVRNATPPLTAAQLKAIDGHQPVDPPSWASHPQTLTPVKASSSDSWSPDAWLIALMAGGAVVLAGGAFLIVTRKTPVRSRAGV